MALTQEEILADLAEIVEEVAGIDAADVQLDKSFTGDLDVDSLTMVEVVVAAEEKFDVKIPDDEVKDLSTVGDAVGYIQKNQAEPRQPPDGSGPADPRSQTATAVPDPAVRPAEPVRNQQIEGKARDCSQVCGRHRGRCDHAARRGRRLVLGRVAGRTLRRRATD